MEISVELTLTPLQDDFELPIIDFIKALRASGCTLNETPLSTQVYGEFSTVMALVTDATKKAFENSEHIILNMKVVKSNRSDYEPFF
jgi:uncharacterized protein YqgV (UPF0045/DUF77 family)